MKILNKIKEGSSSISESLTFLQKWKFQIEDDDKKHEMTEDFREERLKRRGKREKGAA